LPDEVAERPQGLLDRGQRVGLVLLVEVDPVGLEPSEARLDLGYDVMARGALKAAAGIHRPREFGRQHDVLAAVAEDLAKAALGAAARITVSVGLVEERDAEVERLVDDLAGRREIDTAAEIVAAEPDHRDPQAGFSEISLLHPFQLPDRLRWRRQ